MKTTYVSTQGVANATRRSVLQMQSELTTLQKEVTTGRAADVGLALGACTGQTVALRRENASLQTLIDSNAVAGARLSVAQETLGSIATDAQGFLGILIDAKSNQTNAAVTQQRAGKELGALIANLNSSQQGDFVFGGVNSGAKPVADYSDPSSPAKQAVADAFLAHFGFAQSDPATGSISAADIQDFLDTDFSTLFDDAGWAANWSAASDQPQSIRMSPSESVAVGVTANDASMRKLAMAYTMVSDLGLSGLSSAAYGAVIQTATGLLGSGTQAVTSTQAQLGYSQQAVTEANSRMSAQKDVLETHIGSLEGVDPYEASTRINNLLTQIETSYALTARIQQLSLLDFLR